MITLDTARKRLGDARGFLHIDERESELEELETQIAAADFWDDTDVAQRVSKRASDVRDLLARYTSAQTLRASRVLRRCSIRSRSNPGSMVLMTILARSLRSILAVGD